MPVTRTEIPILGQFFCVVRNTTGMPLPSGNASDAEHSSPGEAPNASNSTPKQLPKGVVLGKDGKPCRSCTSFASWAAMTKSQTSRQPLSGNEAVSQAAATLTLPPDCPPDVEALGRSTWTLLHTLTAMYPSRPTPTEQQQTRSFISLFSNMYPCSHCAEDFREWMNKGNGPRLESRDEFGRWMCEAHNAVNEKLGKDKFDCSKWEERWRTGPEDGRCG